MPEGPEAGGSLCVEGRAAPAAGDGAPAALAAAWRFGDALFETMRVGEDGVVWREALHRRRMREGAARCLLPWPGDDAWADAVVGALAVGGHAGCPRVLRVWLVPGVHEEASQGAMAQGAASQALEVQGSGTRFWSAVEPLEIPPAIHRDGVVLREVSVPHPGLGGWGKSVSWQWGRVAQREARAAGADAGLLLRPDGEVAEAASAAVLWREAGVWRTCRPQSGALASTAVQGLVDAGVEVQGTRATLSRLAEAEAVCLASALRLVVPVRCLVARDGRELARWSETPGRAALLRARLRVPGA